MINRFKSLFTKPHPKGFEELEYAFTLGGKRYYRWTSDKMMPLDRVTQLELFILHRFTGLLGHELTQITEAIEANLLKAVENRTNDKAFIKYNSNINALLHELKLRDNRVIREQNLYDTIAIAYCREDENPKVYSNEIHREKVDTFMKLAHKADPFFFRLPEAKNWLALFSLSEKNWDAYTNASMLAQKEREMWIRHCSPDTESKTSEKTGKAS